MTHILEIDSLIVKFDNRVILNSVYLKLETGNIIGLFGRNGSGKSSLMQFIMGNLIPDQGHLRYNSSFLTAGKTFEIITFLPQHYFIPNHFTILKVMQDYALDLDHFIKQFPDFNTKLSHKIKTLSGGEKRLVEFYLVLFSTSKFCILDEPFASVMPKHIDKMIEIIKFQSKTKGILVCDHQNEFVKKCMHQSYRIENQHIILDKSDFR